MQGTVMVKPYPKHEDIRRRAYELYVERGRRPGHARRDWLDAEAELRGEIPTPEEAHPPLSSDPVIAASQESFPASDAPGWRWGLTVEV